MAKAVLAAYSVLVQFAKVAWFEDTNVRVEPIDTDDAEAKVIRESMKTAGWRNDIGDAPIVSPITPELRERAVDERTAEHESLRSKVREKDGAVALQAFERLFVENGKIVVPEYWGATGHRRQKLFRIAMVERLNANKTDKVENLIQTDIAVVIRNFKDMNERLLAQIAENEKKAEGAKGLSLKSELISAATLVACGYRQAAFAQTYKRGSAMKIHGFSLFNNEFPKLHLIKRMTDLPAEDPDYLSWGKVPQNIGPEFERTTSDGLKKFNEKRREKQKPEVGLLDEAATDAMFRGFMEEKKNEQKVMPGADVRGLEKVHKNGNPYIAAALAAVGNDNRDLMLPVIHDGEEAKCLFAILRKAHRAEFSEILENLVYLPDSKRKSVYAKIADVVGVHKAPKKAVKAEVEEEAVAS